MMLMGLQGGERNADNWFIHSAFTDGAPLPYLTMLRKKKKSKTAHFALVAFLLGLLIGLIPLLILTTEPKPTAEPITRNIYIAPNTSLASIKVPAVDENGKGVTTTLTAQVIPGSGKTLTNIDKLLFWIDTQHSMRTSRDVAENVTGRDLSGYDIIYGIEANATLMEGSSAGAALTVATIAALENRPINQSVFITGTVNHDGTIGPVAEVMAKALAAKQNGGQLFLVPLMQSLWKKYKTDQHCEKVGEFGEFCTTEIIPQQVGIANETGIAVKEVVHVREALEWFLG